MGAYIRRVPIFMGCLIYKIIASASPIGICAALAASLLGKLILATIPY